MKKNLVFIHYAIGIQFKITNIFLTYSKVLSWKYGKLKKCITFHRSSLPHPPLPFNLEKQK